MVPGSGVPAAAVAAVVAAVAAVDRPGVACVDRCQAAAQGPLAAFR